MLQDYFSEDECKYRFEHHIN